MPDAKSLLPGRAFRSEHAQLRPEPHSIASHGPAPMDPLQTTRMRNGVLYAAEWPCCHDPLRLSLGSEDPFYHHNPRVRRARLRHTSTPLRVCGGGRARRARRVRAPPPRAGRRAPNALPKSLPPLPQHQPRRRARAPKRPRARGCLASTRVCPSLHITPPLAPRSTLPLRTALPNPSRPPLPCVLPPCPPQTPPFTSAMCPSRPRRHWPHLSLVRAPRPPAHLPHTHAPLPSSPALRPRHLLRVVVSVSRARRRRRALRGRPRRRRPRPTERRAPRPPLAPRPPTNYTNRHTHTHTAPHRRRRHSIIYALCWKAL